MSVSIEIEPRTSGYSKQTLTVLDGPQAVNYDTLREQLGLRGKVEMRIIVQNEDESAVLLVPSGVKSGNRYFFDVSERSGVEMDGCQDKWRNDPKGAPFDELSDFNDKGSSLQNAAANGFLGNGATTPLPVLFPDANAAVRAIYSSGLASQTPQSILPPAHDDTHLAGLSHEPTLGDLGASRSTLLRWAFVTGTTSNQKPADAMPSVEELREAYKRGKEAVCITISAEDWPNLNKETFKLCAVPVEYAVYEGGVKKKLAANKDYRYALRECFKHGVDDAWAARENNAVTQVGADHRVPSSPSLLEAFSMGQNATKAASSAAPGSNLVMTPEFEMKMENAPEDAKFASAVAVFREALASQWASYSGAELPKLETRFPDTGVEQRDAYNVGVAARKAEEKRKEDERLAEEQEREAANKTETTFKEEYVDPCLDCLAMCHPKNLVTEDSEGHTLCCGTTLGDWTIILFLFLIYYLYLGMWYWAFIEVLMVVAEPQRPW